MQVSWEGLKDFGCSCLTYVGCKVSGVVWFFFCSAGSHADRAHREASPAAFPRVVPPPYLQSHKAGPWVSSRSGMHVRVYVPLLRASPGAARMS